MKFSKKTWIVVIMVCLIAHFVLDKIFSVSELWRYIGAGIVSLIVGIFWENYNSRKSENQEESR